MIRVATSESSFASDQINVLPLVVRTPHGGFNRMVVSVTVCEPGTERCTSVDDVMVATGSTGLRLDASAVPTSASCTTRPGEACTEPTCGWAG